MKPTAALLVLALLTATPALAIEDTATGLKVELPAEFVVEATQRPDYQATIGVNTVSGTPTVAGTGKYLCEIGYQDASQNNALTQAEINATIGTPDWLAMAATGLEAAFTINSSSSFALHGANGGEFIGTPKAGPDGLDVRVSLSMLETPLGRTVVTCATTADQLDAAMPVFRAIRDGVVPPG